MKILQPIPTKPPHPSWDPPRNSVLIPFAIDLILLQSDNSSRSLTALNLIMHPMFRGHSLANPDELWHPVEKARYAARDPLKALKKYLIENNVVNDKELKAKCYCFT
ncbi:unnamed protein product, partial [Vitis vinifera]